MSKKSKEILLKFMNYLEDKTTGEGLGERRVLFYLTKARVLEVNVGIIPPTDERLMRAIEWVGSQERYGMWSVIGYKETIGKLWKFTHKSLEDPDPEPSRMIKQMLRTKRKMANVTSTRLRQMTWSSLRRLNASSTTAQTLGTRRYSR
ncbi:MAG: hypothetical protein QXV22_05305 [Thermoplasmataceae archaeon]